MFDGFEDGIPILQGDVEDRSTLPDTIQSYVDAVEEDAIDLFLHLRLGFRRLGLRRLYGGGQLLLDRRHLLL